MKNGKFLISTFLFLICLFSACETKVTETIPIGLEDSKNLSYSKIEDVDFRNFSYSYVDNFTLENGDKPVGKLDETGFRFRSVQYADLTNDGRNEAIINLQVNYTVSAASLICIYTLEKEHPIKLGHFLSGVFANGGLKDVKIRDNNLMIEFFGDTKFYESTHEFIFPNIHKYPQTECCSSKFTKFNFRWNGIKFILIGKPELFDYDWKKETHENLLYRKQTEK
jgi:hypothetical protein